MVLQNFECWALGGDVNSEAAMELPFGAAGTTRHVDPFNPRELQQAGIPMPQPPSVSHISSNGYYGFSYVNAAHEMNDSNNNNNNNNNNIDTTMHNNNGGDGGGVGGGSMGNDVNGTHQNLASVVSGGFGAAAGPTRCKKRYFVSADDYDDECDGAGGGLLLSGAVGGVVAGERALPTKRCRFDDDCAAQYCNDFFSLPSTQIGTQACLMDTEDFSNSREMSAVQQQLQQQQQQLPQVDVAMATTPHNFINNSQTNEFINDVNENNNNNNNHKQCISYRVNDALVTTTATNQLKPQQLQCQNNNNYSQDNNHNVFNSMATLVCSKTCCKLQQQHLINCCDGHCCYLQRSSGSVFAPNVEHMFAATHGGNFVDFVAKQNLYEDI